jgi:hypothetical protein
VSFLTTQQRSSTPVILHTNDDQHRRPTPSTNTVDQQQQNTSSSLTYIDTPPTRNDRITTKSETKKQKYSTSTNEHVPTSSTNALVIEPILTVQYGRRVSTQASHGTHQQNFPRRLPTRTLSSASKSTEAHRAAAHHTHWTVANRPPGPSLTQTSRTVAQTSNPQGTVATDLHRTVAITRPPKIGPSLTRPPRTVATNQTP